MAATCRLGFISSLKYRSNIVWLSLLFYSYGQFISIVLVPNHSLFRFNSTATTAPRKITTHYTVHPRDKDERWKGFQS